MILVTGAAGFVGKALCAALLKRYPVRSAVRDAEVEGLPAGAEVVQKVLSVEEDWSNALIEVNVVVHCAARVHVMNEQSVDPLTEFRRVNVDGTLRLAKQAAAAGVNRFIFLSSIKVNGEQTKAGRPFTADQQPDPGDPYGISKMEAENGLRILAKKTGMEVVIIRPPLVYGPGVKANFLSMMQVLWRGIPLPFGAVTSNKRSLVSLDNLINLIVTCLDHPAAANQSFLISDGEDLSTAALLRRMSEAIGRPAHLLPVPVTLLQLGGALFGKRNIAQRLCSSLEVDISKTRELLGWKPPISVDEGLRRTAVHWLATQQGTQD
jgi:UDP-glucose 4-epimerase